MSASSMLRRIARGERAGSELPDESQNRSRGQAEVFGELARWIKERQGEKGLIPDERKAELREVSGWIGSRIDAGETARIVYICTHNSRRSHLAQVWAQTAAHVYGVAGVETYSGGTEATAFNPRAVVALTRAGFHIQARTDEENPVYSVRFADDAPAMRCFSKVYDQPPNPRTSTAPTRKPRNTTNAAGRSAGNCCMRSVRLSHSENRRSDLTAGASMSIGHA